MTLDPNTPVPGLNADPSADANFDLENSWKGDGPWVPGAQWLHGDVAPKNLVLHAAGPVRWDDTDVPALDISITGRPSLLCDGQFLVVEAAAAALRMLPIPGGVSEPQQAFEEGLRGVFGPKVQVAHRASIHEAVAAAESLHPHPGRQSAVRLGGLPGHRALQLPNPGVDETPEAWLNRIEILLEPLPNNPRDSSGVGVVLIAPYTLDPYMRPIPLEVAVPLTELAHERDIIVVADLRRWLPARGGSVSIGFNADVALLDGDVTSGLADIGCLVGNLPPGFNLGSVRPSDAAAAAEVLRQTREEDLCGRAHQVGASLHDKLEACTALDWVISVEALGSFVTVAGQLPRDVLEWADRMRQDGLYTEIGSRGVTFALPVDTPAELIDKVWQTALVAAELMVAPPTGRPDDRS
ncbi:MAG: hypothetical protein GY745_12545 [Actinomycetia bacterium]|nr:hypothetical protein [Actinomycetes bacterium]